jgi:hypothetical protein
MNGTFGITYEQLQPKLFLSAGPSATKHGPNKNLAQSRIRWVIKMIHRKMINQTFAGSHNRKIENFRRLWPSEIRPKPSTAESPLAPQSTPAEYELTSSPA